MLAADGSDVRKLTSDSLFAGVARYSPDGSRIAFVDEFCVTCGDSDVWVMNADGSGQRQVTNSAANEITAAWSKDSTRVVVDYARLTETLSKSDVAVVAVATGATVNLTNTTSVDEAHPTGSHDHHGLRQRPGPLLRARPSCATRKRMEDVVSLL
jgi:Tol biopolymer transport system component